MPEPISSQPRTFDRESEICDPSMSSCADSTASSAVITIEPVIITGNAGSESLVKAYDAAAPQCRREVSNLVYECGTAALAAASTGITAPTGVGLAISLGVTALASAKCGQVIADYLSCRDTGAP